MRDEAEFFEEIGQIPSKEFGLVLTCPALPMRWSLRREYLGKEQLQ